MANDIATTCQTWQFRFPDDLVRMLTGEIGEHHDAQTGLEKLFMQGSITECRLSVVCVYLWDIFFIILLPPASATYRYLGSYQTYATGDTIIYTLHNHGGSRFPHRKWLVECLDGEAAVGIQDLIDDFERLQEVWCKFMFPYKPPSAGVYPYYPNCFYRNYTTQFHCFNANNSTMSMNSFVTGVWDDDLNFFTWRIGPDDTSAMKCCTTPKGYYIDYGSCYYSPTHDQFGEFYDSNFMFLVYCSPGNVMTGMAKKLNPSSLGYNIDWIQCCRLGYGVPQVVSPPVTQSYSGHPTYYAKEQYYPSQIPSGYQAQYRSLSGSSDATGNQTRFSQKRMWFQNKPDVEDSGSYKNSFALDGPYNSAVKL